MLLGNMEEGEVACMKVLFNGGKSVKCIQDILSAICNPFFSVLKKTLESLEKEINDIEKSMTVNDAVNLQELWTRKRTS